jgi:O-6-methylguanine DNA methyltransferase
VALYYTDINLPTGPALAVATDAGLSRLYLRYQDRDALLDGLAGRYGDVPVYDRFRFEPLEAELKSYFAGSLRKFTIALDVDGTGFQDAVWKALRKIPYGTVVTYGMLAQMAGRPGAARAVGGAVGANPVPVIIPCHRVVASGGGIGGFSCGVDIKRRLLDAEGVRPPYTAQYPRTWRNAS